MRLFRRKNDGQAKPEDGVRRPEEDPRGAAGTVRGGDGAGAPQPDSTVHPMDAVALGLDQLGLASSGGAESKESPGHPEPATHPAGDGAHAVKPVFERSTQPSEDVDPERLREAIIDVLRTVYDPEIPVNIYEIGLVYQLDVTPHGEVTVQMTLTSPMCPVAESLPPEVEAKIAAVQGVTDVKLDLVWDPPWNPSMMSEEARLLLNIG
jgi:FeS assembly SUF system protein